MRYMQTSGTGWLKILTYLREKANSEGYACHDNWGSARYNTAEQLICLVYDKYNNSNSYTTWAKGQMEYLFRKQ